MWKNIKLEKVDDINKMVAEFEVSMHRVLPYGKMKVKIYESVKGSFTGYTDVKIKRKFDGESESCVGFGNNIDEALEDTIRYFLDIIKSDYPESDYPEGLTESEIEYMEYSDF